MTRLFITIISLLALISLCSCSHFKQEIQDSPPTDTVPSTDNDDVFHSKSFVTIEEFISFINDPANKDRWGWVDPQYYVNFDSIIPDSEVRNVISRSKDCYTVNYGTEIYRLLTITFANTSDMPIDLDDDGYHFRNENYYTSIEELKNNSERPGLYRMRIEKYDFTYMIPSGGSYQELTLYTENYYVKIFRNVYTTPRPYTEAQMNLVTSIFLENGATDESIVSAFERIVALLPQE